MNVVHRLRMISESFVGILLLGFFVFFCALLLLYFILRLRQRSQDALAYRFQHHYEQAKSLMRRYNFVGRHKSEFFGRETIVQGEDDSYALCLIPAPNLLDSEVIDRFKLYHRTLQHQDLPLFSRYVWTCEEELLILVQDQVVRNDGKMLTTLREFILDHQFGQADTELILLEIARALGALHQFKLENGENLFYGMLMPRSVFLGFDSNKRIDKVVLPHHGMAMAVGAKRVSQSFAAIGSKYSLLEPLVADELEKEEKFLAPEQLDEQLLEKVGPAADFFAFATLALYLFTGEVVTDKEKANWEAVPEKWRLFLQTSLEEEPEKRPLDFLSLQDHLFDPDVGLTIGEAAAMAEEWENDEEEAVPLSELKDLLQNSQSFKRQEAEARKESKENPKMEKLLAKGKQALSMNRWSQAKKHFEKAREIDANEAEVNVGLAIVTYEMGNLEEAERFYSKAKEQNELVAKRFRDHIAFRV